MICYLSSGFGSSGVDGTFTNSNNTFNDVIYFKNENNIYLYYFSNITGDGWGINGSLNNETGLYGADTITGDYNIIDGTGPSGSILLSECEVATTTPIQVNAYTGPNFQEWLFVGGVIIFFLSFLAWGRIFRPISVLSK
jgi:hypothetical protein